MRGATNGEYPRFAVWENVPGAFSSNNGEDFRIVLQELIKVTEPKAVMPEVPKSGWAYADSYSGDGWSLAYRVFDAQYWGVPQRRRRIYLVADFRGECAEKILFEREGLRGYFKESGTKGQTVTSDVEGSIGADDREGAFGFDRYNQCSTGGVSETIRCPNGGDNYPTVCYGISSYDSNAMKSSNPHSGIYEADTSRTLDGNGGNPSCNQGGIAVVENVPYTLKIRGGCDIDSSGKAAGKGALIQENLSATLGTSNDQYLFQPIGFDGYNATGTGNKSSTLGVNCGMSTGRNGVITLEPGIAAREGGHIYEDVSGTLRANMGDNQMAVAYGVDAYNQVLTGDKTKTLNSAASDADHVPCTVYSVENHPADSRVNLDESGKVQTLTSRMGTGGGNVPMVMEPAVVYAIDKAITTGGNCTAGGSCVHEEIAPTLTTDRPHAVAYGHHDSVVISRPVHSMTTGDYMQVNEEKTATLLARDYKDPTCVEFYDETSRSYIVRRLTPTECARLQGFPDEWGHIEPKSNLTDEEYEFWKEVHLTKQIIDGKVEYGENGKLRYVESKKPFIHMPLKRILSWYNKLWTDSSEYKMWGNGIALPCALYVMQGIKESLVDERSTQSNWLDDFLRRWSAK